MCIVCAKAGRRSHFGSHFEAPLASIVAEGFAAAGGGAAARAEKMPKASRKPGERLLIRGGAVMSMDPDVGDFPEADILLDGAKIVAIRPHLEAGDAQVIDARGRIVMPGFIDTHHHLYETAMRGHLADALLAPDGTASGAHSYGETLVKLFPHYRSQDMYINELFGALSQLDCGVTTVHDTSQAHHTPEHADAAVQGLKEAGGRAVFCYVNGGSQFPDDVGRLRREQFSSDDMLVTMSIGGEISSGRREACWKLGRELGLQISSHVVGTLRMNPTYEKLAEDGEFGPDNLFIHMTGMSDLVWRKAADAGAHVSIAAPINMVMRHGLPPIQKSLDFGMAPSLSTDVECTLTADPFTQMRACMGMQRALLNEEVLNGKPAADIPPLLTSRDVLRFATVNGAKGLRLDRKTGTLTPGKDADIVILDATAINVAPLNFVPGAVVALMERSNVETVLVAGAIRKWKGRLLNFDIAHLRTQIEASRDYLFEAAGIAQDLFRPN